MHNYLWLWLTLASGVFLGFYDIFKKKALEKIPLLNVLALYSLFSFILVSYDVQNALKIDHKSLFLILIKSFVIFLSWILGFAAIKNLPISIITPFGTLSPVISIVLGIIVLNERLKYLQFIGIILILISYYLIGITGKTEVRGLFKNKFLYLMAGSGFLSAISAIMDKIILRNKPDSGQVQFWFCFFLMLMYSSTFIIQRMKKGIREPIRFSFFIPLTSLFLVVSDKIYFIAVKMPGSMMSLVIPLRKSSIVISAIVGGVVFKEKNLLKKFICILVLMVGVIIIFSINDIIKFVNSLG